MKTIYAFDFDGTITKSDTLLGFIGFVFGKPRMTLGFLLNLPWLVLMASTTTARQSKGCSPISSKA